MTWTTDQFKKYRKRGRSEEDIQKACVRWFRYAYPKWNRRLIASLNGAPLKNGAATWSRLESLGAVKGEADLFLAVPSGEYGGLFIEMKTAKGRQRKSQKEFEADVLESYGYKICRSLEDFQNAVKQYLADGEFE